MRILESPSSRTLYEFVQLSQPALPPGLFPDKPFRSLIVISCPMLGLELEEPIAQALVEARCGWVAIFGPRCKEWEETIDWENVRIVSSTPDSEDFLVVTSAHDCEPLEEVAGFIASILVPESQYVLVIGVGPSEAEFARIAAALHLRETGNAA